MYEARWRNDTYKLYFVIRKNSPFSAKRLTAPPERNKIGNVTLTNEIVRNTLTLYRKYTKK